MARQIRIDLIHEGFTEVLCSDGVMELVSQAAGEICDRANSNDVDGKCGFYHEPFIGGYGGGRWIDQVRPTDWKAARIAEAEYKVLSRAVM